MALQIEKLVNEKKSVRPINHMTMIQNGPHCQLLGRMFEGEFLIYITCLDDRCIKTCLCFLNENQALKKYDMITLTLILLNLFPWILVLMDRLCWYCCVTYQSSSVSTRIKRGHAEQTPILMAVFFL